MIRDHSADLLKVLTVEDIHGARRAGTDGGTTPIDDLQAYAADLRKEHERCVAQGVAAPGEGVDTHPFVDDLRGPGQFRKLARLLAARGHGERRVARILGGNFIAYAGEVWGA